MTIDPRLTQYNHLITTEHPTLGRFYGTPDNPYQYPSASTILKYTVHQEGLTDYYKNNTRNKIDKTLEDTANIGTQLHDIFDKIAWGKKDINIPPIYAEHVGSFEDFLLTKQVEPVITENIVVSKVYGFAGRVDFFGMVNGKLTVVDWKTGNQFGDTWGDQCAGYQLAICEMLEIPDNTIGMGILQIPRNNPGETQYFSYTHLDWMQDSFLLALERYKRMPRFNQLRKIKWPYLMEKSMRRV